MAVSATTISNPTISWKRRHMSLEDNLVSVWVSNQCRRDIYHSHALGTSSAPRQCINTDATLTLSLTGRQYGHCFQAITVLQ
jgi:hypothetical protein